jgi:hypothetical protein
VNCEDDSTRTAKVRTLLKWHTSISLADAPHPGLTKAICAAATLGRLDDLELLLRAAAPFGGESASFVAQLVPLSKRPAGVLRVLLQEGGSALDVRALTKVLTRGKGGAHDRTFLCMLLSDARTDPAYLFSKSTFSSEDLAYLGSHPRAPSVPRFHAAANALDVDAARAAFRDVCADRTVKEYVVADTWFLAFEQVLSPWSSTADDRYEPMATFLAEVKQDLSALTAEHVIRTACLLGQADTPKKCYTLALDTIRQTPDLLHLQQVEKGLDREDTWMFQETTAHALFDAALCTRLWEVGFLYSDGGREVEDPFAAAVAKATLAHMSPELVLKILRWAVKRTFEDTVDVLLQYPDMIEEAMSTSDIIDGLLVFPEEDHASAWYAAAIIGSWGSLVTQADGNRLFKKRRCQEVEVPVPVEFSRPSALFSSKLVADE